MVDEIALTSILKYAEFCTSGVRNYIIDALELETKKHVIVVTDVQGNTMLVEFGDKDSLYCNVECWIGSMA